LLTLPTSFIRSKRSLPLLSHRRFAHKGFAFESGLGNQNRRILHQISIVNLVIFGATGMVGQGALRECLRDPDVHRVLTVGRSSTGTRHPKLQEIVHQDLFNYAELKNQLAGFDACFFCLGVSSSGMSEADYTRITHDIAVAAAQTLAGLNPQMTFLFISGAGADSTERGPVMWARVKGKTENVLRRLPFKAMYVFRPGIIQPLDGIRSKTAGYRVFYAIAGPLLPIARRLFPDYVVSTEQIGRALLAAAKRGSPKPILEAPDIRALALSSDQPSTS
jgi:uncharacterized protein YbjT (DUF2867 family)